MNQKTRILFVAEDPGGFNTLWPIIKRIMGTRNSPYNVRVILAGVSRAIARDVGIDFVDGDIETDDLSRFLDDERPELIVCGTSHGLSLDKKVLLWAREKDIRTMYIIDYWSDYRMRFSTPLTLDMMYLPDSICIIDEIMLDAMIKEGFPKKILHITGNPFFDTFQNRTSAGTGNYIVFASQPFSETYDDDDDHGRLSEITIFSDYARVLEECGNTMPVYIALHPREKKKHKFDKIIANSKLNISITQEKTIDIARGARLIVGIRTMLLFEVAMLGKAVISYQPGITSKDDVLVSNHLGVSTPAYSYQDLVVKIKEVLATESLPKNLEAARKKYIYNNSTEKVIVEICNLTSTSKNP